MRKFDKDDALKYKSEMENDGWEFSNTFARGIDYYTGTKEKYLCHISTNDRDSNDFDSVIGRISIWDDKELWVEPPYPNYSWNELIKNTKKCDFCGKYSDKIVRIAFVNKACPDCEKEARKELEVDGWYD